MAGWVRNREDGAVEGVLEGEPGDVDDVVALVHGGPGDADVSELELDEEQPRGLEGFEIRP